MAGQLFPPPKGGWICFHCGEVCRTIAEAAIHFGEAANLKPGCLLKLDAGEQGLLRTIREIELQRDELEVRLAAVRLGLDKDGEDESVDRFRACRVTGPLIDVQRGKAGR